MIKRHQWFEFCDQAWLPGWMREAHLDCLNFVHNLYQPYHHLAPALAEQAVRVGANKMLDLASGGGEQIAMLMKAGERLPVRLPAFIVSDLFPNIDTWRVLKEQLGAGSFDFIEKSLSALDVRGVDCRHWSIFTAFHHFAPHDAKRLLSGFVKNGDDLCIIELTKRRWFDLILMIMALPLHLAAPFFAKKFRWSKFLFTTIIPVVPLMVSFDGIVSVLRSYKKKEIIAMLPPGARERFDIQYKEMWWRFVPLKVTMLSLTRKKAGVGG